MEQPEQKQLERSPVADRYLREDHELFDAYGMALPFVVDDTDAEYHAVRDGVALMDFSHLRKVDVEGPGAKDKLNELVTRDLASARPGRILYGPVVGEDGLMRDDSTIMVLREDKLRIVGSPGMVPEVISFAEGRSLRAVERHEELVHLPLQGPLSRDVLAAVTSEDVSNEAFPYYTFRDSMQIAGVDDVFVTRMGYTMELGYELFVPVDASLRVYDALMEAGGRFGIRFVGVESLLIVRTESGLILGDGAEYDETVSPWECGLGWAVDLDKGWFRDRDALVRLERERTLRLVSVVLDRGGDGASGAALSSGDEEVGHITLSVTSPHLSGKTLGLAHIHEPWTKPGTSVIASVGDEQIPGQVVPTPVYDPDRARVKS